MKRNVALARLKPFEHRLRERGISALYLFGSTARYVSSDSSDLDLLFEYDEGSGFTVSLIKLVQCWISQMAWVQKLIWYLGSVCARVSVRVSSVIWFKYSECCSRSQHLVFLETNASRTVDNRWKSDRIADKKIL